MPGFDDLVDFFDAMQSSSPVADLHRALFAIAEIQPGMRVADVGGGPSYFGRASAARGAIALNVDSAWRMLLRSRQRAAEAGAQLTAIRGDALFLPLAHASVDRVFCSNLMFLHKDAVDLMRELGRVLRPGGKLLALNPTRLMTPPTMRARSRAMDWHGVALEIPQAWSRAAEANHPYSKERFAREARAAGLVVEMMVEEWDGMALLARARKPLE